MKLRKELTNLRWYCDLAIEGARLQHDRLLQDNTSRCDMDFYLLCVWRLWELARRAASYRVREAETVQADMHDRWPFLDEVRNWWVHAKSMEWTTWFSDGIYRMRPDDAAQRVIHIDDHEEVEQFYERLCEVLGPLTDH